MRAVADPKPLLVASFEHLRSLGLVVVTRDPRQRALPTELLPLRLATDAQMVQDFVKSYEDLPLDIRRFGSQMTV
jgi:hypothetical protein